MDPDRLHEFRHALANPLGALLTEVELMLSGRAMFDAETRESLQEIEKLALRMRGILKNMYAGGPAANTPPPVEPS